MGVKLLASSNGSVELVPTNTASNFTVTVPAVTGTMLTNKSAGTVLQVVNATYGTQVSSSTSTFVDTGLTATITPTSASSKILVLVSQTGLGKESSNTTISLRLMRGASSLFTVENYAAANNATTYNYVAGTSVNYLDSPATTSATTYKTQFNSQSNTAITYVQGNTSTSTITLMEIAA